MVQRLNASQTRQIIRDLVPQGLADYQIPEPIDASRVEDVCAGIAACPGGRCYGWFDAAFVPRGLLVGMIIPDPMTGRLHGFEHAWWTAKRGKPALELLQAFEKECRSVGCTRVTLGASEYVEPVRTKQLYQKLGYSVYNTAFSKELA